MKSTTTRPPLRNAPCPCGSGKKYKHCCGLSAVGATAAERPATPKSRRDWWLTVLGLLVLAAVSVFALVSVNRRPAVPAPSAPVMSLPTGSTPKAWEFDAANNRHWDPTHGHWHDGPPPAGVGK